MRLPRRVGTIPTCFPKVGIAVLVACLGALGLGLGFGASPADGPCPRIEDEAPHEHPRTLAAQPTLRGNAEMGSVIQGAAGPSPGRRLATAERESRRAQRTDAPSTRAPSAQSRSAQPHIRVQAFLPDGRPVLQATVRVQYVNSGRTMTRGRMKGGVWSGRLTQRWPPRVRLVVGHARSRDGKLANARETALEIEPQDGETYTLQLAWGEIIEGRVLAGPGVQLHARGGGVSLFPVDARRGTPRRWSRIRMDPEFRFKAIGLEPGRWKVAYDLYGEGVLTPPRPVIVEAGTRNVELEVERGATVRGVVDVPAGVDPAGLSVYFEDATGHNSRSGKTDAYGTFAIVGLHPEARGRLSVSPPSQRDRDLYPEAPLHDVPAGHDSVRLRLLRAEDTTGHLALAERGMVVPRGADVSAYRLGADAQRLSKRATRIAGCRDGRFRLRGLPPGMYDLVLGDAPGLRGVAYRVEAGAQGVALQVERRE